MVNTHSSDFAFESTRASEDSVASGFTDDNICGQSASCTVYRMRLQGLRVAVKRLKKEYLTFSTYVAAYRKEFQIGRQLKHDALPTYRDLRADTEDVYIVMDYIDGISLEDFLATPEGEDFFKSAEKAREFLSQLLDVVTYLHRSGVIHCDLKPANIMLRHSDRHVMLLDLDKAYSDTLDLTHGGTPTMSNPMENGAKPTAAKDLTAIARLIDYIAERNPKFPARRFSRIRNACLRPDVTDEQLSQSLQSRSDSHLWTWIACIAALLIAFAVYIILRPATNTVAEPSGQILQPDTVDTVRIIDPAPTKPAPPEVNTRSPQSENIAADFDIRMAGFITEAKDALSKLSSGNMSDDEIRDLMYALIMSYNSKYLELLAHYKAANPDIPGFDVEMSVAKASERSIATKLQGQFAQAAADTLTHRHPVSPLDD